MIPSPCLSVLDAPFHENVHACLAKRAFEQAKKIQMFVWPAIMRNMNVCYVNGAKSGKTMAYLPAVYSFLLEDDRYSGFNAMVTGPLAVVLCDGNKKAEDVYDSVMKMKTAVKGRDGVDVVLALLPVSTYTAVREI